MLVTNIYPFSHNNSNSLLNDEILNWSNLKAFTDNKIYVTEKIEICFVEGRERYGKRRKCWLLAFFLFPIMFPKDSFFRVVKIRDYVVKS